MQSTTTPAYDQRRWHGSVTAGAALLDSRRMLADGPQTFPLYPSRTPLPYTLSRVYDAGSLQVLGGYSFQYPTATPSSVGLNDVTTGHDVAAARSFPGVATPLTTFCRGSANGAGCSENSHRLSATRSSSVTSPTTAAVTPNGATTPRRLADSGIASRRRRVASDAVGRTRRERQRPSHRPRLFAAAAQQQQQHASDDSSSTTSYEHGESTSPPPVDVDVDASTTQRRHGEVVGVERADSSSLPTSDSAYSDADELPDVAER